MLNITINSIGKNKCQNTKNLCEQYIIRVPWNIKLYEFTSQTHYNSVDLIQEEESKLLLHNVKKTSKVLVLDENGEMFTSIKFAEILQKLNEDAKECTFLIGGAYGHHTSVKNNKEYQKISLGKLTFPHSIARLLLIEQIYRAYTLITGHPYHKF